MDLDLVSTFLELERTGTMSKAAGRLHVTQATVSARVAQLEAHLNQRLFERSKAGTKLTAHGASFLPYARQLMHAWDGARQAMVSEPREALAIGGEYTLATGLLLNWLVQLRTERPTAHLRTVVDTAVGLLESLHSGALDVVTLYSPLRRPTVKTRLVLSEELVCVSTESSTQALSPSSYVYVDWGPDFRTQHERALPDLSRAATKIGLGPLALRYLLRVGGAGYFRTRAIGPYLKSGQMHVLSGMPAFSYSIYAATAPHSDPRLVEWALDCLVRSAAQPAEPWA